MARTNYSFAKRQKELEKQKKKEEKRKKKEARKQGLLEEESSGVTEGEALETEGGDTPEDTSDE